MKCPNCGAENKPGQRLCEQCATPLPQAQTCPQCGASNPPGMRFCGQCAAPLTSTGTRPPVEEEQTLLYQRPDDDRTLPAISLKPDPPAAPSPPSWQEKDQTLIPRSPAPASPAPTPPVRRQPWPFIVGGIVILVVTLLCGSFFLLMVGPGPVNPDRAAQMANEMVTAEFPEFAGKQEKVLEYTDPAGKAYYLVSYGYTSEVQMADNQVMQIPRLLVVQVAQDGSELFIIESD